jgi:CRISPR-associated endonuclease/helicase Cas3
LSACSDSSGEDCRDEFLSHPSDNGEPIHSLLQHSIDVAIRARDLLSHTCFQNPELGFFSGLLHDLGKLSPYYQILFRTDKSKREAKQNELIQKYAPVHSPYSAWMADKLLKIDKRMDYTLLDRIITLIYRHHTRLQRSIAEGDIENSERFRTTQQEMYKNISRFYQITSQTQEFSNLGWTRCLTRFLDPVSFDIQLNPKSQDSTITDFLEVSVAFSCLLQADRGSFSEWNYSKFDKQIDTSKLVNTKSKLSSMRDTIQNELLGNIRYDKPIVVINAPTGSGKTKVFLDSINHIRSMYKNLERIFYFSPLLALTEDFEEKVADTIHDLDEVLVYNHLFSGSIEEKRRIVEGSQAYESQWIFENESFNRPFIITTTQRLLITLFSNNHADKLKLASFRNSLLIVDEVQTIPKYILGTLVKVLESMYRFLGTRTILVSATIPYELRLIPIAQPSVESLESYLNLTKKSISFQPWSISEIEEEGRTLIMANTRRKAATIFDSINKRFSHVLYLSSGVRKRDKIKILSQIHGKKQSYDQFILVSTQVVEAGVDISFSHVYREKAPLDSIIQVMGRLNRESEQDQARLTVFVYDNKYKPYSELELNESEKILREAKDSTQLYSSLAQYYKSISEKNESYKEYSRELERHTSQLDFDKIWEFINNHVLDSALENERDIVLIPDIQEWDEIKQILSQKKLTKTSYRRFADISATLPKKVYDLGIEDYFDAEVLEKNILLPKKEYLNEVYDAVLGTDKWLIKPKLDIR